MLETDRPHVLREMIYVCRPAGVLSVPGVYGGLIDKIPFGMVMNKGLTIRTGQTHVEALDRRSAAADRGGADRPVLRHHPHRAAGGGRRRCTRCSATSRTAASRWFSLKRMTRIARHADRAPARRRGRADAAGRGLGWFSIGLGVAGARGPPPLCAPLGLRGRGDLVAAYGMREIATGIGILTAHDRRPGPGARRRGRAGCGAVCWLGRRAGAPSASSPHWRPWPASRS